VKGAQPLRSDHTKRDFEITPEPRGRVNGGVALVRIRSRAKEDGKKPSWLLIKERDERAREGDEADVAATAPVPPLAVFVPQLATLERELPPPGPWGYEIKLDGYRAIASRDGEAVRIVSRNQKDWSARFPEIESALKELAVDNAVFDGEICAIDDQGRTRFEALQDALSRDATAQLVYFIFDLLFIDGIDVRDRPFAVRKAMLESILDGVKSPLAFVRHFEGAKQAKTLLGEAARQGLEGLMVKRLDAPYRAGRGRDWLKVKCLNQQELVIVGFTKPSGSRDGLGALLLGVNVGNELRYAGKVGTGFSDAVLRELSRRLAKLVTDKPAVVGAPRLRDATWVEPSLVCQVAFTEWTKGGALRHPSFLGLREDKAASEVVVERPEAPPRPTTKAHPPRATAAATAGKVEVRGIVVSHATRVVDETAGLTKLDLVRYHEAVGDLMLPYARSRPLALVRCPDQIGKECFFQKKRYPGMPAAIHAAKVARQDILYVEDVEGILSLVQFGGVEIHGWGSRLPHPDKPDWIVMDLDPDEALPFERVVEGAFELREALQSIGLESFVKTTGGKGLHVVAPIAPEFGWSVVKRVAESIATGLEARLPSRFTANMGKRNRVGKIFIDYLRNGEGATAILPYAARARPGLTVALPVAWSDLRHVDPHELTIATAPALLAKRRRDPWESFFTLKQGLPPALGALVRAVKRPARA
jgi:bifunctional non-homologous end joining protein LigD